jgi:flagellar export protein FliJ
MSKRFQFRHQTLLDVAKQHERSVQIEVSHLQTLEAEARRRLEAAVRLTSEWDGRIRQRQKGTIEPNLLKELFLSREELAQRMVKAREEVRAAVKAVEAARERLQEAARDRKSYERLRERRHAEYETETSRQLVKLSDETASVRAASARTGAVPDGAITGVPG